MANQGPSDGPDRSTHERGRWVGWLTALGWWAATISTLVILDDLTFGPFFWAVSLFASPYAGFAAAVAIYTAAQIALVRAGTSASRGGLADRFLRRLDVERRSQHIAGRERNLKERITTVTTALVMTLLIGGVLPPLLLWRRGWPRASVHRLSYATALVYAVEFGLLHGLAPGTVI